MICCWSGPGADFPYLPNEGADSYELAERLIACREDFRDMLGRHGVTTQAAMKLGRARLLVFLGREFLNYEGIKRPAARNDESHTRPHSDSVLHEIETIYLTNPGGKMDASSRGCPGGSPCIQRISVKRTSFVAS
jgi:hypothetical protein